MPIILDKYVCVCFCSQF